MVKKNPIRRAGDTLENSKELWLSSTKPNGFPPSRRNPTTLAPKIGHFDYIIIGGGASGCALATTLSQNATVLVLKRGGSPYDNPTATDIGNFSNTALNNTPNS
ncbi:hypothetical protein F2Q70_00004493 [Brassica cretica]|uniref:Glucose-methanol-choline oxidoreductase N-terminal domain-containing protein n=1 Tax=Brassica cretica TaxID=69181 RepID=A0A8S9IZ79_BRACR|nr:hypothetical protein F2Q70_00004493 [Brassica cretica]